ncbi:MAG: hypothetical protein LBG92_03095 [Prevotellaceae bacterium]|jgi:hypothetical protein|nr:hypothetical protein [Prevotellaceae bacterium]
MALNRTLLEQEIKAGFDAESDTDVNPAEARARTAKAIADAVNKFVLGATVTVAAGIPVSTAGTAAAQTGATTATGTGTLS